MESEILIAKGELQFIMVIDSGAEPVVQGQVHLATCVQEAEPSQLVETSF